MILQAEGQKESNIRIAEGNQLSQELDAKGKGVAIETIAEAERFRIDRIKSAKLDPQFLSYKSLEALGEIAKGQATTLFVPTEAVNVLSSVGSLSKIASVWNKKVQIDDVEN